LQARVIERLWREAGVAVCKRSKRINENLAGLARRSHLVRLRIRAGIAWLGGVARKDTDVLALRKQL
jgi:hypothetical protein